MLIVAYIYMGMFMRAMHVSMAQAIALRTCFWSKPETPHLKPGSREEDEPRGFNIIKLIRNNGLVIAIQYYKVNMIKSTITIETAVEYKTN